MTNNTQSDVDENIERTLQVSLQRHWRAYLIEGAIFVFLGILAIIAPVVATLAVAIYIGFVLLLAGGARLVWTLWTWHVPGFWWSLFSAIIAVAAGVVLLARPVAAVLSLTLLLTVFFIVEGVFTIMFALEHRRGLTGRWTWMLVSGVIDLLLAAVIIAGLPGTAAWALGLLVGINLIFAGIALIGIALDARNRLPAPATGQDKAPA